MDIKILSHRQIQSKIERIAYQIYENNIDEKEVIIVGMMLNGYPLAQKITDALESISPIKVVICSLELDKDDPLKGILSIGLECIRDKSVVLVDDVLSTGKHLIYGVRYLLSIPTKRFNTAVLVNRNHKTYPVKADFKGISLSTSLRERIKVVLGESSKQEDAVYLK